MKKWKEAIKKDFWVVLLDIVAVNLSYFLALVIRFYVGGVLRPIAMNRYMPAFLGFAPWYTVICIVVFMAWRLYGGLWRYAGINDMNRIIMANLCTTIIYIAGTAVFFTRMAISYYAIGSVLQFIFIVCIRFGYRMFLVEKRKIRSRSTDRIDTVIIGDGETGRRVVKNLEETDNYRPIAVVGNGTGTMDGIPIISIDEINWRKVEAVFVADSLLPSDQRVEIRKKAKEYGAEFHDYTGYFSNLGGRLSVTELLSVIPGPVTIDISGVEKVFNSGGEALDSITKKYDVRRIEGSIRIKMIEQEEINKQDILAEAYASMSKE